MKAIMNLSKRNKILVIAGAALLLLIVIFFLFWRLIPNTAVGKETLVMSPVPQGQEDPMITNLEKALENDQLNETERASLQEKLEINQRLESQQADLTGKTGEKNPPTPPDQSLLPQGGMSLSTPEDEIIEGSEGVVPAWVAEIQNLWQGQREGIYYQVLAGASADSPDQGILIVIAVHPGLMNRAETTYQAPQKGGALRIQSVEENRINLVDQSGNNLVFDLQQRAFVQ